MQVHFLSDMFTAISIVASLSVNSYIIARSQSPCVQSPHTTNNLFNALHYTVYMLTLIWQHPFPWCHGFSQGWLHTVETDLYTKPTDTSIFSFPLVILITLNAVFLTILHFAFATSVPAMTVTYSILMNLLTTLLIVVMTKPFPQHKYTMPQTFLVPTHLKTNFLHGLKPPPLLLHVILHCLCPLLLRTL